MTHRLKWEQDEMDYREAIAALKTQVDELERELEGQKKANGFLAIERDRACEQHHEVARKLFELKAQAGEPDFYVRRRPSPGYEVVSSSDPMAQPAYLHPTTERPYNPLNDYAVIPMPPTTERQNGEEK